MPSIHHRKLIPVGNSVAVVLPPSWLEYYGLKAGDEVLVIADHEIKVTLKRVKEVKQVEA